MKNLIQYVYGTSVIFHDYLTYNTDLDKMIAQLREIEESHIETVGDVGSNNGKGLWFRFFEGDTLATTISDLENDLNSKTNRQFTLQRMKDAIELDGELFVYYS